MVCICNVRFSPQLHFDFVVIPFSSTISNLPNRLCPPISRTVISPPPLPNHSRSSVDSRSEHCRWNRESVKSPIASSQQESTTGAAGGKEVCVSIRMCLSMSVSVSVCVYVHTELYGRVAL